MGDYYNARIRLIKPSRDSASDDGLQREYDDQALAEQRCSLRDLTALKMASITGRAVGSAYRCRLQSTEDIRPGWKAEIKQNNEAEWHTYEVSDVSKGLHYALIVELV